MEIESSIPFEILAMILGCLLVPEGLSNSPYDVELSDLRNARLVCRRWNSAASSHMFRNVALLHSPDDNRDFTKFKQLVSSPTVQHAARYVEIYSAAHHYHNDVEKSRDSDVWFYWEQEGDYEELTSASNYIVDLPKLQGVHLHFSRNCVGPDMDQFGWDEDAELPSSRFHTIKAAFEAIQTRAALGHDNDTNGNTGTVTALTIQNLQNKSYPDFVVSVLFRSVAKILLRFDCWWWGGGSRE